MSETVIDTAMLESLVEDTDAEFVKELIDTFLDDAPNQIDELHQALVDENSEVFRRAAHTLKSNSANFGADSLAKKAKELEKMGREGNFEGAVVNLEQLEAAYDQVQFALKTWQHDT